MKKNPISASILLYGVLALLSLAYVLYYKQLDQFNILFLIRMIYALAAIPILYFSVAALSVAIFNRFVSVNIPLYIRRCFVIISLVFLLIYILIVLFSSSQGPWRVAYYYTIHPFIFSILGILISVGTLGKGNNKNKR